jgi:hypothetical protein
MLTRCHFFFLWAMVIVAFTGLGLGVRFLSVPQVENLLALSYGLLCFATWGPVIAWCLIDLLAHRVSTGAERRLEILRRVQAPPELPRPSGQG